MSSTGILNDETSLDEWIVGLSGRGMRRRGRGGIGLKKTVLSGLV